MKERKEEGDLKKERESMKERNKDRPDTSLVTEEIRKYFFEFSANSFRFTLMSQRHHMEAIAIGTSLHAVLVVTKPLRKSACT